MNSVAIAMGGGVRVGLEDQIWYDQHRTKLARNTDLLHRIHELAHSNERDLMSSVELRNRLNLLPGNGADGRRQQPGRRSPPSSEGTLPSAEFHSKSDTPP